VAATQYDDRGALEAVEQALREGRPLDALEALHSAWLAARSMVQRDLVLRLRRSIARPGSGRSVTWWC
jgi:hypothetical protein